MTLNKLVQELEELQNEGYGKLEVSLSSVFYKALNDLGPVTFNGKEYIALSNLLLLREEDYND